MIIIMMIKLMTIIIIFSVNMICNMITWSNGNDREREEKHIVYLSRY